MFPYNLPGPQFLLFYVAFSAVLLAAYAYYLSTQGSMAHQRLSELTADPYRIVFLRAGRQEVVRVAVVNLVDRGLLEASGSMLRTTRESAASFVHRDLDRAILELCATPQDASTLESHPALQGVLVEYEVDLARRGLLLDQDEQRARTMTRTIVLLVLAGVAGARFFQALARGQTNVVFIILLVVIACWIALSLYRGRATPGGRRALASIKTLTERVTRQIERLKPGGETNEALLMAAVYGIYALPSIRFDFVEHLYPRPKREPSSCSTDSGGSGCGGGGGGGGCGGCGGD